MKTLVPTRWNAGLWPTPWRMEDPFETRLTRFFEPYDNERFFWNPVVDVEETEAAMTLTAELAGMDSDDVDIEVENNVLTISGEKKEVRESKDGEGNMRVWERNYGKFARSFTLPATIDANKIHAEFDKGILKVYMPKTTEAKGRRIAVQAKK